VGGGFCREREGAPEAAVTGDVRKVWTGWVARFVFPEDFSALPRGLQVGLGNNSMFYNGSLLTSHIVMNSSSFFYPLSGPANAFPACLMPLPEALYFQLPFLLRFPEHFHRRGPNKPSIPCTLIGSNMWTSRVGIVNPTVQSCPRLCRYPWSNSILSIHALGPHIANAPASEVTDFAMSPRLPPPLLTRPCQLIHRRTTLPTQVQP
jgi:hypothetical protein